MKYIKSFAEKPSYLQASPMNNLGSGVESTVNDPRFHTESHKPYEGEVVTRALVWDYYRVQIALPNPSAVLQKLGLGIEAFDDLLEDARVKAALNNRRSGLTSLKWTLDQNESPDEEYQFIKKCLEAYPIYDVINEMLLAIFYGYMVTEIVWQESDMKYVPIALLGKAPRWFMFRDNNELVVKSKMQMVQGEPLPVRKFIVTKYRPTYSDPYSGMESIASSIYWPVHFRRAALLYANSFAEKYGTPWIDIEAVSGVQKARLDEAVALVQETFQDGIIAHDENFKINALNIGDSKNMKTYSDYIDMLNREIDMCILGTNLASEVQGGSFAATKAHMGVRDDIIQNDIRMIEAGFNQLIEWIDWYNWPAGNPLPKFKLIKADPPTKERSEIDINLAKLGVKFSKAYIARTYAINDNEFEIGQPRQDLAPGQKGEVEGAMTIAETDKMDQKEAMSNIAEVAIEAKDPSINTSTRQAYERAQSKGYMY